MAMTWSPLTNDGVLVPAAAWTNKPVRPTPRHNGRLALSLGAIQAMQIAQAHALLHLDRIASRALPPLPTNQTTVSINLGRRLYVAGQLGNTDAGFFFGGGRAWAELPS